MQLFAVRLILTLAGCRFAAAMDLKAAAKAFGVPPSVCAHFLMVQPGHASDRGVDPLIDPLEKMIAHVRQRVTEVETAVAAHRPIGNEVFDLLLNEDLIAKRRQYTFGDQPDADDILSAARSYFHLRYLGRGYLEYKMKGRLVDYTTDTWSIIPPAPAGRYDALVNDLMLSEQRLTDLLRAQPAFRAHYRERRRTKRPGTTKVLDFGADEWVDQREVFSFNLDDTGLPDDLKHIKQMVFSTYTEDHSFSHFAQSTRLETLSDALVLSRDTLTTVVSTRLTSRDVFQLLHLLVMNSKVPIEVNHEGWAKNKASHRPMLPVRLKFPSGGEPGDPPITLGLVICTATPCRVKDLDFKAGEIISVFPISGPGVVRIPPSRDLRRALVHGQTKFNEADFVRPVEKPKVLEPH